MEPSDQNEINFETMLSAEPWDYMTDSDKRNAIDCANAEIARLRADVTRLTQPASRADEDVCQILGAVLGYPEYPEGGGVCTAPHVAATLASEMADKYLALRAELEQARENKGNDTVMLLDITSKYIKAIEERDEAVKRRDFAVSGEENLRYLKQLWEQECGYYRAQWWEAVQANDRSRRAIAALAETARVAMIFVPTNDVRRVRQVLATNRRRAKQAGEA